MILFVMPLVLIITITLIQDSTFKKMSDTKIPILLIDNDKNEISKTVKKNLQTLYYDDGFDNSLIFGAIFADPGIYECQVKRLLARTSALALLYSDKSAYLKPKGCNSNLEGSLNNYASLARATNTSFGLRNLDPFAEDLRRNNELLSCKLF